MLLQSGQPASQEDSNNNLFLYFSLERELYHIYFTEQALWIQEKKEVEKGREERMEQEVESGQEKEEGAQQWRENMEQEE